MVGAITCAVSVILRWTAKSVQERKARGKKLVVLVKREKQGDTNINPVSQV